VDHGWIAHGERYVDKIRLTRRHAGTIPSPAKEIQRKDRFAIGVTQVNPYDVVSVYSKTCITTYVYQPLWEGQQKMKLHEPAIARPIEYGIQKIYRFDNGFGASVIKSQFSYGGDENLWELAVIAFNSDDPTEFELTYETPITNDVIGNLSDEEVEEKLTEIKTLSWRHNDGHIRNSDNHSGNLGGNPTSQVYKKRFSADENN
jgi:hypothetical protein